MESDKTNNDQQKDPGVTMVDILQEEQDLEDDANAVLGGSDDKFCTYSKGYIKRQALYACTTCTPEAATNPDKRAGVCLACSYHCHESHELVELYTKRNFRCDCGGPKMKNNKCNLDPFKNEVSENNIYNQNFSGLYCKCSRPYPDPEETVDDEMIQCIVCEDWYHCRHLGSSVPSMHNYSEMICSDCMSKNEFLQYYLGFAVTKVSKASGSKKKDIKKEILPDLNTNGENKSKICDDVKKERENVSDKVVGSKLNKEDESALVSSENESVSDLTGSANSIVPKPNRDEEINVEDMETPDYSKEKYLEADIEERNITDLKSEDSNDVQIEDSVEKAANGNETDFEAVDENSSENNEKSDNVIVEDHKSNVESSKNSDNCNVEESHDSQDSIVKETANILEEIANINKEFNKNNNSVEDEQFTENSKSPNTIEEKMADKDNIQDTCENLKDIVEDPKNDDSNKVESIEDIEDEQVIPAGDDIAKDNEIESDAITKEEEQSVDELETDDESSNIEFSQDLEGKQDINADDDAVTESDTITEAMEQSEPQKVDEIEATVHESSIKISNISDAQCTANKQPEDILSMVSDASLSKIMDDALQEKSESDMEIDEENISELPKKDQEEADSIDHSVQDNETRENLKIELSSKRRIDEEDSLEALPSKRQKVSQTEYVKKESTSESGSTSDTKLHVKGTVKLEYKPVNENKICIKPQVKLPYKGAVFWSDKWRTFLCSCSECLEMYKALKISFLLDMEDTVQCYEEQGKTLTTSQYEIGMKALSSLDHVKQVNAITEYNKMKDKLKAFLQTFADNQQIVTEEDIKHFFATMKTTKRSRPENSYYCR